MPPSGYSKNQSSSIVNFLQSVSESLEEEGKNFKLSPEEAIKREINNINIIEMSDEFSSLSNSVLLLTKLFYERILEESPKSYESFRQIVRSILPNIHKEILTIHVPSISKMV